MSIASFVIILAVVLVGAAVVYWRFGDADRSDRIEASLDPEWRLWLTVLWGGVAVEELLHRRWLSGAIPLALAVFCAFIYLKERADSRMRPTS